MGLSYDAVSRIFHDGMDLRTLLLVSAKLVATAIAVSLRLPGGLIGSLRCLSRRWMMELTHNVLGGISPNRLKSSLDFAKLIDDMMIVTHMELACNEVFELSYAETGFTPLRPCYCAGVL